VEVDIEDTNAGRRMEADIGITHKCWGHGNTNTKIHDISNNDTLWNDGEEEIDLTPYYKTWYIHGKEGFGTKYADPKDFDNE
jgi:hypothetical protein